MFGTEILPTTAILILIFIVLITIVLSKVHFGWHKNDRNYHLNFLGLLFSGLIYNLAEGLLPDKNFKFDIISQNILAYTIGLIVAFHYLFYVKTEYKITFPIKISYSMIGIITLLILIFLFILPYTITKSLSYSRIFFIGFFLMTLALASIIVISRQIVKLKKEKSKIFKIHHLIGIFSFLSLLSLPFTIFFFGDNQLIEQSFFSIGFLFLTIDFSLYEERKKESKKLIPISSLSRREYEILTILFKNSNFKYNEIGELLNISEKTVSFHISNIYKKLGVKNKTELKEIIYIYPFLVNKN